MSKKSRAQIIIYKMGVLIMALNNAYLESVYEKVEKRNPGEKEFLQAVYEVLESLIPVVEKRPDLVEAGIIDRIVEPERQIISVFLG